MSGYLGRDDRERIVGTAPYTVRDIVTARAADDRAGLIFEGRVWSYRDLVEGAARRAHLLLEVRRDGPLHVGLLLDNVPDFTLWLAAGALAGAAVVPFNPTRRGVELAGDIAHMRCQMLVTEPRHRPLLEGLDLRLSPDRIYDVEDDDYARVVSACDPSVPLVTVEPSTPFLYMFTSGSTGAPKACRVGHGRFAATGKVLAAIHQLDADDVAYEAMPFFHSSILASCWVSGWVAGACHVMRRRFSASEFLDDVRRHGVTYFGYVGKPLAYILATTERADDADNTLRAGQGNEGSPLHVERFSARFGCDVRDGYGSTEGCVVVTRTADTPFGSLGMSSSPTTMVVDPETRRECPRARFTEEGELVNPDEAVGELVDTRGAATFEGYWDNPEAEAARIRDGWYWSGDLAYRDDAGFYYFAGRNGDMVRVDGENLSTAAIERIIERATDIVAVGAYAVPDDVGDQLMICLQLRTGTPLTPAAFAGFLDEQADLGTKMRPRYVRITTDIPLTASQKIDRRRLRDQGLDTGDPVWVSTPEGGYEPLDPSRG